MEILNAVIVDDEVRSRRVLRKLLVNICPVVKVIGEAGSVAEAHSMVLSLKPHLVFLDIQMPTGNGFSLLEKFTEIPFDVIFVTAFDQYAINAIKFSALDYLLKPIDRNELKTAVERAQNKNRNKNDRQVQIINLLNNIDPLAKDKRISVHKNEQVLFISVHEIIYIVADDRYSTITTIQNKNYTLAKTLREFEDFFTDNPSLVRISRSLMINADFVQSYTKDEPCIMTMQDGKTFEVSRRKKQEVLDRLKK